MRKATAFVLLAGLAAARLAAAGGFSYTGSFATDNDKRVFYFDLTAPGAVILRTFSYGGGTNAANATIPGGGFDPTLSVYDSSGNLLAYNRDGGCGSVAADSTTSFCWDSYLTLQLPAGHYRAVLTQSDNLPNGPTLADSFVYDAQTTFTAAPGNASPGFWDFFPSKRTASYAVDIGGAASSETTTITSSATLPGGVSTMVYPPFTFTAQSGPGATLAWSVISGSLPAGWTLNASTGILSGGSVAAGSYSFTVQVTDGIQPSAPKTVTLLIYNPLVISTATLPSGMAGHAYTATVAATGGSGNYNWSATGLPANLAISAAGQITGTPASGGSFTAAISVSDAGAGLIATVNLPLTIAFPPLQITGSGALGGFVPGSTISSSAVAASGGQPPYTWSATGLPPGFNLNASTGAFSGTGPAPGVYGFTLNVSDSQATPATASLPVGFSVLGITTSSLVGGSTTAGYSQTIGAIGGTPPYSFSGSGLPAGLSLSSAGLLSGTPSAVGTFSLTLRVTDSAGLSTASNFALVVTGPPTQPLSVTGGQLTSGNATVPYSTNLTASGGTTPYTWSLTGGILPDGGVSLSASGAIAGTPKTPGIYTFTALAKDSAGASASGTFTISIGAAPLVLTSGTSFPTGIAGSPYPLQILSASGGAAPYTFTIGNGALPDGLIFASPQFSGTPTAAGTFRFTVTVTDAAGNTASLPASITISPAFLNLILSQTNVPFSMTVGSGGVPTPASVTVSSSDVRQILNYSVIATPAVSWLDVTAGANATPGSIAFAIDPSALSLSAAATPYQTTVIVTCVAPSPCAGIAQTIAVSLDVTAPAPQLSLTSALLNFSEPVSNATAQSQSLGIQNSGGGTLTIGSVTPGDSWLTVGGAPSAVQGGPPTSMTVTTNPAGLAAGIYRSAITVVSSAGTTAVPVVLNLTQIPTMTLGPAGTTIQTQAGNAPGNTAGSFNVNVTGGGSAAWSASVLPGAAWLSVSTPAGNATDGNPGTVSFAIDPTLSAGLSAGTYTGSIQVTSGDVADSPLVFQVYLNVNPAGSAPPPQTGSSGLVFNATTGTPAPSAVHASDAGSLSTPPALISSQTIPIYASSNSAVPYQASASTFDSGTWLSVSPSTGFASASAPGQSVITTNATGLAPGVYRGGISYAFASDAVRTVNITLLVKAAVPAGTVCTPSTLVPTQTGLFDNFAEPAGWPTPLAIDVLDNCGSAVPVAQVVATFSNGDPPLTLVPADNTSGTFIGTWTPRAISSQVTVTSLATSAGLTPASVAITGSVRPNNVPLLNLNTPTNVWNPLIGGALAPGAIIQIYGSSLAAQSTPSTNPLTTKLGNTSVTIGGIPAPLYYAGPGQINAQVPFELTPGNRYQLIVNNNGAFSTPAPLQLASVAPGIATYLATGAVIAQHADYSLVTEDSPARPGEYLMFYLTGLGATDTPVATGAPSPLSPLAHPLAQLTLTLNGAPVPTAFVGLTPTLVGLYQVNFQMPATLPSGDLTLSVAQSGVQSNTAILPVQQ